MDTHLQDQCVFRVSKENVEQLFRSDIPRKLELSDVDVVARLPFGAQWYGIKVKDWKGKEQLIMSAGPESQVPDTGEKPHRDWNARIFCFDKLDSTNPGVKEIALFPPTPGLRGKDRMYCRVDPRCQDDQQLIYFMGHNSIYDGCVTARFRRIGN
ncbi:hypothetical protein GCM10007071_24730 [Marinobacter zhanjiangensis]|uniref:Uncharacterized protein n=2 Tax=Marinobacter zhanjiangensis TaxID=578215 RepID=A0ABQ3B3D4_9GAMM|nr:hypothetical protein GCM10007071_24730 [Marinobacter zhanjiangensis]